MGQYKEDCQVILQQTLIHRMSPKCFHLNRSESSKDSSSEAQLQSSKTSRGSYLCQELYIFVKKFELYLVIQSFKAHSKENFLM